MKVNENLRNIFNTLKTIILIKIDENFLKVLQDCLHKPLLFQYLVTTLPAPITAPEHILTGKIVELEPIITPSSSLVGKKILSFFILF